MPTQQVSNFQSIIRTVCCGLCCFFARNMLFSVRSKSSRCIIDELLTEIPSFLSLFMVFALSFMGHRLARGLGSGIRTSSASCIRVSSTSLTLGVELVVASAAIDTTLSKRYCISSGHITTPGLTPLATMINSSIPVWRHNSSLFSIPQIVRWLPPAIYRRVEIQIWSFPPFLVL